MASALAKRLDQEQQRRSAMLARARQKAKVLAASQQHSAIAFGASYLIGMAEKRGLALPSVGGVDPKLLYAVGALGLGFVVRDAKMRAIAQSVGDGLGSIVAYQQGRGISPLGG